jgi:hypothetical protein
MNSFISSSSGHGFRYLMLSLLAVFVLLEVFTRMVLFQLSKDFVRFQTYKARADTLAKQPGLKLAFFGNSATEEAIDPALLENALKRDGVNQVSMELFLADGSEISTWRSMINHYFWKRSNIPNVIVITFFGNNLDDAANIELGRLAQFFTDVGDWPDLFGIDLRRSEQCIEFLLSSAWATYAARDRIKQRVLNLVVPNYRIYEQTLHDLNRRYVQQTPPPQVTENPVTHRVLQSLLDRAREQGVKVFLVEFPMSMSQYKVSPEIQKIVRSSGADYIDMRDLIDLQPVHYRDEIHLNASGKLVYTKKFAEILISMLERLSKERLLERYTSRAHATPAPYSAH